MADNPPESSKMDPQASRTKQVGLVCCVAGVTAFFALDTLAETPTWPTAIGVIAVMGMVTAVCYLIVKKV